jgi:hypothetical protein
MILNACCTTAEAEAPASSTAPLPSCAAPSSAAPAATTEITGDSIGMRIERR